MQREENVWTMLAIITGGSRGLGRKQRVVIGEKGVDVLFNLPQQREQHKRWLKPFKQIRQKAFAASTGYTKDVGGVYWIYSAN